MHLACRNVVSGVVFKSWPVHFGNGRVFGQMTGHGLAVFTVPLHPKVQGLEAAQDQEAVHGSGHRPARVLKGSDLFGPLVVRRHQATHHHVGVASEVLGHAVHHHVRPQIQRVLEHGGGECVVHHHARLRAFHQVGDRRDVRDLHHGVGWRFNPNQARVLVQRSLHRVEVAQIHKVERDAVVGEDRREQAVAAPVEVVGADHLVPGLQRFEQGVHGRQTGGK